MAAIAINGFGRIGRCLFRAARGSDLEVVAINDLAPPDQLAYLLRYDSAYGRYPGSIEVKGSDLVVDGRSIRVLGERWNVVHAYFLDGAKEDLGQWTGGWRAGNSYSPDGSLTDSYKGVHQWVAIPAGRAGELALISKANTSADFWVSGIAFSKNPWAHAVQSAVSYFWKLNGGDATAWGEGWHSWNNDTLTKINPKTSLELKVPVVPSVRDFALSLVRASRPTEDDADDLAGTVRLGASPRAAQALLLGAKVRALAGGRKHVTQQDVIDVACPVLSHRILLDVRAQAEGRSFSEVIDHLVSRARQRSLPQLSRWTRSLLQPWKARTT